MLASYLGEIVKILGSYPTALGMDFAHIQIRMDVPVSIEPNKYSNYFVDDPKYKVTFTIGGKEYSHLKAVVVFDKETTAVQAADKIFTQWEAHIKDKISRAEQIRAVYEREAAKAKTASKISLADLGLATNPNQMKLL